MSDALRFASFRSNVLRRIDNAFEDRKAQRMKANRASKSEDPLTKADADLLIAYLDILIETQGYTDNSSAIGKLHTKLGDLRALSGSLREANSSELVCDQIQSILIHFTAYYTCHLIFSLHLKIYRNYPQLEETIQYWSERRPERWRWWYLVEKTPLFWMRYFQVFPGSNPIIHPELEVKFHVVWLEKLKIALNYFIGYSHYNMTLLPLNSEDHVKTLTVKLMQNLMTFDGVMPQAFIVKSAENLKASSFQIQTVSIDTSIHTIDANSIFDAPSAIEMLPTYKQHERHWESSHDPNDTSPSSSPFTTASSLSQPHLDGKGAQQDADLNAQPDNQISDSESPAIRPTLDEGPQQLSESQETAPSKGVLSILEQLDKSESALTSMNSASLGIMAYYDTRLSEHRIPSLLKRHWMVCGAVCAVAAFGGFNINHFWPTLRAQFKDAKTAIVAFTYGKIWSPLVDLWKTIRYDATNVNVMSKENLESDVESLVRMVNDFNKQSGITNGLTEELARQMDEQTRSGVMPTIMEAYERELPNPIRNIIRGDLFQLLLIQVQKQKVDVEKAMLQLDRLLKQNELTAQLLALTPAILLISGIVNVAVRGFQLRNPLARYHSNAQRLLRSISFHINQNSFPYALSEEETHTDTSLLTSNANRASSSNDPQDTFQPSEELMSKQHYGHLLCLISELLDCAQHFPERTRILFVEDANELATARFTARQRQSTIQRMYSSYRFLKLEDG